MLQGFVEVSPALQDLILFGITALVSFLLLQLANVSPMLAKYFGEYKNAIIVWLVGLIVQLLNAGLQKIPATWDEVTSLVMQLIVSVVAVLLAFAGWKRLNAPGASALK